MFRFGRVLVHRVPLPYPSANALCVVYEIGCQRQRTERSYTEMYVCRLSLSARPLGRPVHVARVKSENQKALVEVLPASGSDREEL